MPAPPLYLFDDRVARGWLPFALTRPVGELLFGCLLQRQRIERAFGATCAGHLAGDGLVGFEEPGAPSVLRPGDVAAGGPRLLVSSRAVPAFRSARPEGPATLVLEGEVVGWSLGEDEETPGEAELLEPGRRDGPGPVVELEGSVLPRPWHLVERNAARIRADLKALHPESDAFRVGGNVHVLGQQAVSLGHDVDIEPGVLLDVREGPVRFEDGVRIQAPARIVGPCWLGEDTVVFGGSLTHVSVGPVCKVRGEMETSVVLGYANKAHDGYLGHAYLGRWVNLGAFTTNSDLKNNYAPVRMRTPAGEEDTGLLKVGCFLGDHVKTGIGTLLNTGTVLGAGTNVWSGRMPPVYVPPFSWGTGDELTTYRLDKFLEVAERAMARRGMELTDGMRAVLRRGWEATRGEREGAPG